MKDKYLNDIKKEIKINKKHRKWYVNIASLIITTASVMVIYIFYLLLWPTSVMVIKNNPVPTDKSFYYQGEKLVLHVNYCKYKNIQGRHVVDFVDTFVYPSFSALKDIALGCGIYDYVIPVSRMIDPGKYYIRITITYQVNSLRTEEINLRSKPFEIKSFESNPN